MGERSQGGQAGVQSCVLHCIPVTAGSDLKPRQAQAPDGGNTDSMWENSASQTGQHGNDHAAAFFESFHRRPFPD